APGAGGPRNTASGATVAARGPISKETRAVSASRAKPKAPAAKATLKARALEKATDLALNAWSLLREGYQGFQRSSLYFKYRVLIVATWGVLSFTGMGVACSAGLGSRNALGARLVVSWVNDQPVYMVVNDSEDVWEDVR